MNSEVDGFLSNPKKWQEEMKIEYKTVDEYISGFPKEVQSILNEVRSVIKQEAPDAIECISYGMPAYKLNAKPVVYFGAFKQHIGLYATPAGHSEFKVALSKYKQGKGSVQFPFKQGIPFNLIKQIVEFRVYQIIQKK